MIIAITSFSNIQARIFGSCEEQGKKMKEMRGSIKKAKNSPGE